MKAQTKSVATKFKTICVLVNGFSFFIIKISPSISQQKLYQAKRYTLIFVSHFLLDIFDIVYW